MKRVKYSYGNAVQYSKKVFKTKLPKFVIRLKLFSSSPKTEENIFFVSAAAWAFIFFRKKTKQKKQ